ncbi:uncharacterized protein N7483_005399 [Penicillium malachiteum]|uniref:uncharacterized protein n=1 Tax=Penicillium malachiteum TaxID=1324776 RepID=UPI0025485689|nr:uncharacterized protein N7483_005399 [Penicillium malachiteum]KAJ5730891.1 hypothetical protein N7483_005399 [Penicillium malachiteum]
MPGDDPFGFLPVAADQPKPVKKSHNWREKLFSKDKNKGAVADKQIEDFLASNRPQPQQPVSTKADPSQPPPTVSTYQVASQDVASTTTPQTPIATAKATEKYTAFSPAEAQPPSLPRQLPPPSPQSQTRSPPRKPRKNKGLRVGFCDRTPEIIGEGGDETEAPTIEISWSRQRARDREVPAQPKRAPSRSPNPSRDLPSLRVNTSLEDAGTQRRKPQDVQSGITPDWKPPLVENTPDADLLNTLHITKPGSRLSFRGSPDSHSFAERVRNQMQVEEARALHNRYKDGASPVEDPVEREVNDEYEDDAVTSPIHSTHSALSGHSANSAHSPNSPHSAHKSDSFHETPISYTSNAPSLKSIVQSIRNPGSPASYRGATNLSPIDPRLPAGLRPGSPGRVVQTPPKLPQPPPHAAHPEPSPPYEKSTKSQMASAPTAASQEPPRNPQAPKLSLRNIAAQIGDTAFTEFKEYINRYDSLLRLAAESVKPLAETSLAEWIRAAVWWFLRGKTRLETFARMRSNCPPSYAKQAIVDLGKALWINEQIVPGHFELSRYGQQMGIDALLAVASTTGDKEMVDLLSLHQTTLNHLRSLSMSVKRNKIIALIGEDDLSPSHLDTSVWLRYPFFAPNVSAVLSGAATRSMLAEKPGRTPSIVYMMPLGDSARYFSYGSMFVQACVSSRDDDGEQYAIQCCLTIIRERADWYVLAAITSQSQLVNIMIQSDRKQGPTWDDVEWQARTHSMRVRLSRGFELDVTFKEEDFKTLWNIVKYTQKSEASLAPEEGETVVYENTVKVFQYMDPGTPKAFPPEPLERCRIRLFERSVTIKEGTGSRNAHRGFRLTVLTSPKVKTLSNVKHILAHGSPVVFGLLRGENGAPALLLKVTEDGRTRSMLITFHEVEERTKMHAVLLGMIPQEGESKTREIPIRSYSIEQPGESASGQPAVNHIQFPAGNVFVIDQEHSHAEHGYGPTILSENLRAFIATEWGSVTDRINLGPGELKIGLDVNRKTGMSLFRPAQQDLTVSLADNLIQPEMPAQVTSFLEKITAKPMARRIDFASIQDLHAFEEAVTGFKVIYDGTASCFAISRRRSVVPIYKRWEANLARVQIVKQEKIIQLVAFFADFQHGTCMNFVLKGTDHIESFGRSGKFGIRIVDAKFALPKTDDDPASKFVCLDMPEYPIEHDDLTITFDSELDRTNFRVALPGSVREPSRMGSLRR